MGFYPIVKSYLEKIGSAVLRWVIKLLTANAALVVFFLAVKYFVPNELETDLMMWTLYIMSNGAFILYDIAVSKLITAYFYKFRERLKIYKLLK